MATEPVVMEEPTRRVNPLLVVLLLLALVIIFFFFVIKPLFFGGSNSTDDQLPNATSNIPVTAQPSPSPSPTTTPAETFEVFESKDPFRPLVVVATAGAPASTSATTTATSGSSSSGGGAAGGAAPSSGQRVQLVDVFVQDGVTKAQVKVGSTVHTVAPGETFATNFKLLSISGNCGTFLHGDNKFTLCKGEEVIK